MKFHELKECPSCRMARSSRVVAPVALVTLILCVGFEAKDEVTYRTGLREQGHQSADGNTVTPIALRAATSFARRIDACCLSRRKLVCSSTLRPLPF